MIKSFNPIKSRRPWPPISISHLFQQGPFSSWPLLFLRLDISLLRRCSIVEIQSASVVFKSGRVKILY